VPKTTGAACVANDGGSVEFIEEYLKLSKVPPRSARRSELKVARIKI
jgi:hypothetical protein